MLTNEQWAALGPLVEKCRPRGKTPPSDLRRTVEAILWRHENGAKWRSIPPGLGPWWMAAQTFIRPRRPPGRRPYGIRIIRLLADDGRALGSGSVCWAWCRSAACSSA